MYECQICNSLTIPLPPVMIVDNLIQSARHCAPCKVVHDAVLRMMGSLEHIDHLQTQGFSGETVIGVYYQDIHFQSKTRPDWASNVGIPGLRLYRHPQEPTPYPAILPAPDPARVPTSDGAAKAIKKWLDKCTCRDPGQADPLLPTRVIYVGSGNDPPRLEVPGKDKRGKYVALTWRWGLKAPLKTTMETIESHLDELVGLPALFQVIVTIAKHLEVDYVWIDCLCIIQKRYAEDKPAVDDWNTESAKMAEYYQGAYFTIAGDNYENAYDKIICKSLLHPQLELPCCDHNGVKSTVCVRPRMDRKVEGYHALDFESPLASRGWCFQEYMLSRRMLHLGPHELAWRCLEWCACECESAFEPHKDDDDNAKLLMFYNGQNSAAEWTDIVQLYTQRELWDPKDRLIAVAGLAELFQSLAPKLSGEKYLAGLWQSQLRQTLSWYVKGPVEPSMYRATKHGSSRHGSYYAPTWSWASVTGEISFVPDANMCVLEVFCKPAGENRYGPSQDSAYLRVKGRLWTDLAISGPSRTDETGFHVEKGSPVRIAQLGRFHAILPDVWKESGSETVGTDGEYAALEVSSGHGGLGAILLKKTTVQQQEAVYERVGMIMPRLYLWPKWVDFEGSHRASEQIVRIV